MQLFFAEWKSLRQRPIISQTSYHSLLDTHHCFSASFSRLSCQLLNVGDIIPGMSIQWLFQAKLVQVVADETNGTTQHEKSIKTSKRLQVITLFPRKRTTRANHINE